MDLGLGIVHNGSRSLLQKGMVDDRNGNFASRLGGLSRDGSQTGRTILGSAMGTDTHPRLRPKTPTLWSTTASISFLAISIPSASPVMVISVSSSSSSRRGDSPSVFGACFGIWFIRVTKGRDKVSPTRPIVQDRHSKSLPRSDSSESHLNFDETFCDESLERASLCTNEMRAH